MHHMGIIVPVTDPGDLRISKIIAGLSNPSSDILTINEWHTLPGLIQVSTQMAATLQMDFSNAFPRIELFEFTLNFAEVCS